MSTKKRATSCELEVRKWFERYHTGYGQTDLPERRAGRRLVHSMQEAGDTGSDLNIIRRAYALTDVGAAVFDWDGVLVDSSRNYYRAYGLVLEEIGITTTPREIYLREGQPTPQLIATLCAERGISLAEERSQN